MTELIELNEEASANLLSELYKMRDSNQPQKFIICNPAFNKQFKKHIIKEEALTLKVIISEVAGYTYIVSPYIKEKEKAVCYITELDLNKICGVNSTYEGTTLYIEDFLYNNIKKEWLANEQVNEESQSS